MKSIEELGLIHNRKVLPEFALANKPEFPVPNKRKSVSNGRLDILKLIDSIINICLINIEAEKIEISMTMLGLEENLMLNSQLFRLFITLKEKGGFEEVWKFNTGAVVKNPSIAALVSYRENNFGKISKRKKAKKPEDTTGATYRYKSLDCTIKNVSETFSVISLNLKNKPIIIKSRESDSKILCLLIMAKGDIVPMHKLEAIFRGDDMAEGEDAAPVHKSISRLRQIKGVRIKNHRVEGYSLI